MTNTDLTKKQQDAIEQMIARRIKNTGETRQQACSHILSYLTYEANQDTTE